jgi:adenosylmethionine-8-amino-7-oxononanoate aminotransferase
MWDIEGREYIDGMAGLFVVNAGHGRAEIGQAMAEQAAKIAYVTAAVYTTDTTITLADTIADLLPGDLNRLFFCSGGSEAVESAIRIARQVQVMRGFPRRHKIIARKGSYHGSTFGAGSLSGWSEAHLGTPMVGVIHAPNPNTYRPVFPGLSGEADDLACANVIEQEILFHDPENVAAVIAEPISVANGFQVPSVAYWRRLREICDEHGVLLIADEVINGWGRTGTWFAIEHYGIVPDMLTMAKGLSSGYAPIGAVAVRDRVFSVFENSDESLSHLITFGGQAVACAAALKNIEIFRREGLVQQAAENGTYFKAQLEELRLHPILGDVRGEGMLIGLELVRDRAKKESFHGGHPFHRRIEELFDQKRLYCRGSSVVRLGPAFVATRAELDQIVQIVDEVLTIIEDEFASDIVA